MDQSTASLKTHQFQNFDIAQLKTDTVLNGVLVPTGYVNAGQMCRVKNKQLADYLKNKETLSFFFALAEAEIESGTVKGILLPDNQEGFNNAKAFGVASGLLIEVPNAIGGYLGTFVHYEIAIDIAQWIDARFRVWANRTLRLVMDEEFIPVTEAAKQADEKLRQFKESLFGGGTINNADYVELAKECREDIKKLRFGI